MTMTTQDIIDAVNAYADAPRTIPDAGKDALDVIHAWETIEKRAEGACVLQAPDGTRVLYYHDRKDGRVLERLSTDLRANYRRASHE